MQGENRFIESICQTIFSLPELLDILNDSAVCTNLKRPYVRFLLWVYLNTASGMVESGAGDLPHSRYVGHHLDPKIPSKCELLKLDDNTTTSIITTELKTSPTSLRRTLIFVYNKIFYI